MTALSEAEETGEGGGHSGAAEHERHFLLQLNMSDAEVPGADLAMDLPFAANMANGRGGLQGGLVATLADVVAGRAVLDGLASGETISTSDLTIHYLAPVRVGPARAAAYVVRRGRRSVVVRVEVYDAGADRHAATCTLAFAVLPPAQRADE